MNPIQSLRPITRRAIPDFYESPGICQLSDEVAVSGSGSSVSSELDFLPVLQKAGPPTVEFVVDGTTVTISWPEVSYAVGYVVYRATDPNGPFTVIASNVLVEEYVDDALTPGDYYYKVTALEPDYGETTASAVAGPATV